MEAQVWQSLGATGLAPETLREVGRGFSDALVAALKLGEIDLLGDYVDWVERMDRRDQASVDVLGNVLEIYYQAVRDQLDERGAPIADWLGKRVPSRAQ
jgi:hypothetical protein